jgi:adenylate kinase family enzyme
MVTGPETIRKHIHITGASGSGVTTLGRALSSTLGSAHLDTDDFFWLPTDPPYTTKLPVDSRLELLLEAFERTSTVGWILAGSMNVWGDSLIPLFDLVVFVSTLTELRLQRLAAREAARFGAEAVAPGGSRHAQYKAFLEWSAAYDDRSHEGRSRPRHEAWLAQLPCPVLRVDGSNTVDCLVQQVLTALG